VVHDDDAVAREADVELEPVAAEAKAVVEGLDRVLGRKRAAAAMREHQRPQRRKERVAHRFGVYPRRRAPLLIESVNGGH